MKVKLKDICIKITDGSHFSPPGQKNGYPMLSIQDMTSYGFNYSNCKYISKEDYDKLVKNDCKPLINDVLIAKDGSYLKEIFVVKENKEEVILSSIAILRPNLDKVNPQYLSYYLSLNEIKEIVALKYVSGSVLKRIILKNFENIEVELPDKKIQDKMVEILLNIDNQIKRNIEMVHKIQDLASSTYSRWFNQFEFPNEDGLPYKSNNGKFVYNEELKRNIPVGWEVKNFLDLIEWNSSSQPPKSDFIEEYKNGYIRFIQNRDYESDLHKTYIPLTGNTKTCTKYDIMIDKYGDAGKTRYGLEGAFNVALAKIEPLYENQQELIRKYLEQDSIYIYLNNACIASTRASLNELVFTGLKIVVPTNEILKDFEIIMKNIINQILDINNNTNELNNLKSKLLPLLINGQLEV